MLRQRTLASQILVGTLAILLTTTAVGGFLYVDLTGRNLDRQYETRALDIAVTVAQVPEIRRAVASGDPQQVIQPLAASVYKRTGAAYVVVTDATGLRFSHPNPALIGRRLEEPVASLDGRTHVGIDPGSLGRSANGKAPVFGADGRVIGQVSVGILETQVSQQLHREMAVIALYTGLTLAIGVAFSLLLARALKRVTFGLELSEIAALVQEREAMLHGIREGVIGLDARGRVNFLNDEARRLVQITGNGTGQPLDAVLPPGRLHDVVSGAVEGSDLTVLTDEALLVVNRRPVVLSGRDIGSVVTLRDRTELEALMRRMNAVTGLTDALRAQEHEFTNQLHVLAGLLDLGETKEARDYLAAVSSRHDVSAEDLRARIAPPVVAAMLLAKLALAKEREIDLRLTDDSHLDLPDEVGQRLMTVVSNLVDNAMDAVAGQPEPREVVVQLVDDQEILIAVSDNGPGVAADVAEEIFTDGFSTKSPRGQMHRGIGLALVRRLVHRAGGTIEVRPGRGARFEVRMPLPPTASSSGPLEGLS